MQGFWFDWVFDRVLLRETAALIEGSSNGNASLPGTQPPPASDHHPLR
jgi:hypothetical protein